ncbi:MAG: GNAT family N-acetyltransferase [Caulobacterales bacterium]|jgi:ribosomal protein S18 acetylase RimI-like enzyme
MAIRRLAPADEPRWRALWGDYLTFYRAALPEEITALTWARLMEPAEPLIGWGACDASDQLIAFALCLRHRSTWAREGYFYLEDLYTAPEARGQGAARALIEAAYAYADAEGLSRVYWVTEHANTRAQALYDQIARRAPFMQYRREG